MGRIDMQFIENDRELVHQCDVDITLNIFNHFCRFSLFDALCSKRKTQEIALARQVAMYLARSLTNNSLKAIGLHFGGRDHSTVIHACTQVAENIKKDHNFKLKVDEIINSLYV